MFYSIQFLFALSRMLLLIFLVSVLIYPTDSLKITPTSDIIQPQISADAPLQRTEKTDEQPVVIEGQFIMAEGNSDHLFRSYDFLKEDAVQLREGDTKDTKNKDKVRHPCDSINPSLPRIQIIEGHFIYYENYSGEHLFDKEDFTKHDAIFN